MSCEALKIIGILLGIVAIFFLLTFVVFLWCAFILNKDD